MKHSLKTTRRILQIFLIPLACLAIFGCSSALEPQEPPKPLVFVSIAPYLCLVQKISGDLLNIQTITPVSANPHAFEPTPRQVKSLSHGKIWFRLGEPFEEKILPLLQNRNEPLVVQDLRTGVPLVSHEEGICCAHETQGSLDRHIWLSPKLLQIQAKKISETLTLQFPEYKEIFKRNLDLCLDELDRLDKEIHALLDPSHYKSFITSHAAFGYFCSEYNLIQITIEQEGKEPRPHHLKDVMQKALDLETSLAIALPQHNNKGTQIVAQQLHIPITSIDPYAPNYIETMLTLAYKMFAAQGESPL